MKTTVVQPNYFFDGIVIVRMALGVVLITKGLQLLNAGSFDQFSTVTSDNSVLDTIGYAWIITEMISGVFLVAGFLTRLAGTFIFAIFMFESFALGQGKLLNDDMLSFVLSLLALAFVFTGAGRISVDHILFPPATDKKSPAQSLSKRFGRYVTRG